MSRALHELSMECRALGREYGSVQARCSRLFEVQRRRIAALEAELVRTRAAVVIQTTARWYAAMDAAASHVPAAHERRAAGAGRPSPKETPCH